MPVENTVVVYGGGMAGALLAKRLSADVRVTLVDPRDYFEVPMAAPRNLVEPAFAERATVPFAQALPGVKLVQGRLVEWQAAGGTVETVAGPTGAMRGRVHVLATGSRFANPLMRALSGTRSERLDFYRRYAERIRQSQRILIVGGGPIGVELAGEISSRHPQIAIALVESGARLLRDTTEAAARHAASVLTRRGVEIVTGDRIERAGGPDEDPFGPAGVALTRQGRRIPYDLRISCTGGRPNTGFMQAHFAEAPDADGRIRVTPQLRVQGQSALFALGDIADLAENKMAWHVAGQVACAEVNVRRVLAGRLHDRDLQSYRPQTGNPAMAVTFGPHAGMVHLPRLGLITGAWLNRRIKATHMLVPKYRKLLGV
jgi:NADH dehydrogenase FAD-containing subunit